MGPQELYEELKRESLKWGADLFGVAYLKGKKWELEELPLDMTEDLPYGISIGVVLCKGILEQLKDHPTLFYLHHYKQANYILDQIAFRLAKKVEEMGGRAFPIAASQIVDWERQRGHLDHKLVAELAGLGWRGRNNLLVSPRYGSRVRLATVLTDLPLKADTPYTGPGCGNCRRCLSACPAGAIGEKAEDFDHLKCFEKLKEFRKKYNLGQYICGVCIKVCEPKGVKGSSLDR